jgi:hypothetical protein
MSLDVYLTMNNVANTNESKIFIREDGQTKEISRSEWDLRFPDSEPFVISSDEGNIVFTKNITHNLNKMAVAAGIYEYLWRPASLNITIAKDLIEPLTEGLIKLNTNKKYFKENFSPSNGWGTFEGLANFVESYRNACIEFPEAEISVSR